MILGSGQTKKRLFRKAKYSLKCSLEQNQFAQSNWVKSHIQRLKIGIILSRERGFALTLCRNPDGVICYARKKTEEFLCIESSDCLGNAPGICSFWRMQRTAKCLAAHGRQNMPFPQGHFKAQFSSRTFSIS